MKQGLEPTQRATTWSGIEFLSEMILEPVGKIDQRQVMGFIYSMIHPRATAAPVYQDRILVVVLVHKLARGPAYRCTGHNQWSHLPQIHQA